MRKALKIVVQSLYILTPFKTSEEYNKAIDTHIEKTIEMAQEELEKEQKDDKK